MRRMKESIQVSLRQAGLALLCAACALSGTIKSTRAEGNPEVKVRVQDPKGRMISKAVVWIHHEWDEHGNEGAEEHRQDELMRVQFDGQADFVITVEPGFYDVYVSSYGYEPKCMKVHLPYGKDRALVFQLVDASWIYTPMVE